MSPGALIAVGFWVLAIVWIVWEIWRAPTLDDDGHPVSDDLEAGLLLVMDDDPTPCGRRHV